MRLLIQDALLATMNDGGEVIDGGSIVIDGRDIAYVGPAGFMSPWEPTERLPTTGRTCSPVLGEMYFRVAGVAEK